MRLRSKAGVNLGTTVIDTATENNQQTFGTGKSRKKKLFKVGSRRQIALTIKVRQLENKVFPLTLCYKEI